MTTTLDFTPARVDLKLFAGDDTTIRLFFATDAPLGGKALGTWSSTRTYAVDDIVEHAAVFYAAVVASTGVTPGTDATKWRALTALDLTGYTAWKAQIRSSDTDADSFTIDATGQGAAIIVLSIAGTVLTSRLTKAPQRWDIQATDPDSKVRTFFAGKAFISTDAAR